MKKTLNLLLCGLLIISCTSENKDINTSIHTIKLGDNKSINLSEIAENLQIIPVETSDTCILSDICNIKLNDENIYINDNIFKGIYIFNNKGKLISKLYKEGRGNGEYTSLDDFLIDNKEQNIEILDRVSKKIFIYNIIDFKLKKIIDIPFDFCFKFTKKDHIYYFQTNCSRNIVNGKKTNSDIISLNTANNQLNILFDKILPDNENQFFEFTNIFTRSSQAEIFASFMWDNNIYKLDNNNNIFTSITIDKEGKGWPQKIMEGKYDQKMNFIKSGQTESKVHFFRLLMHEKNDLIISYGTGCPPKFLYYMELNNGNKIINTNNIVNDMTPSSYNNFDIFSTENNKLISVIYPYREENSELLSHLNVKNDDNPIILIANIKQYEK